MRLDELEWEEIPEGHRGCLARIMIGPSLALVACIAVWRHSSGRYTVRSPGAVGRYWRDVEPVMTQAVIYELLKQASSNP